MVENSWPLKTPCKGACLEFRIHMEKDIRSQTVFGFWFSGIGYDTKDVLWKFLLFKFEIHWT